jgi:LysW-gamma-L-lysine carboxypeptidase
METTHLQLLENLLKHYSPSHQEQTAVQFLVDWMNAHGFSAHIDPAGNAVGTIGQGAVKVLLLGHIDTVAGEIAVRREGDLLYGRGAVDAKGPLATFAAAASLGAITGVQLFVVGAVGEESESHGASYLRDHWQAPNYLIIGEPSRWNRITLGYKGSAWVTLTAQTETAHSASGQTTACELAVQAWNALKAWCDEYNCQSCDSVFTQLTPTLRRMNSLSDGFADSAHLELNFRLPPKFDLETLYSNITKRLPAGVSMSARPDGVPAFRGDKNNPLVRSALRAIRAMGEQPGFVVKTGTSDMNLVAPIWNCPSIAYGPGDSSLDHTPNEHIDVQEYLKAIRVLRDLLEGLAEKS